MFETSCFSVSSLRKLTHSLSTEQHQNLQWFDWWAPLAGNNLHEFKAAVVELDVSGVVILCVDLTGPERTAVLRLDTYTDTQETS